MNKLDIVEQLDIHHDEFQRLLASLEENDYLKAPEGKWNAGQQLDHICRSVLPVDLAFKLPAFVLRLLFGTANRPSRTYEELVEKYNAKLADGGRAGKQFVPGPANWHNRAMLLQKLERLTDALGQKIVHMPENQLDTLIVPHPLLGKLTLREMLYFTIYHVQHHQQLVMQYLRDAE